MSIKNIGTVLDEIDSIPKGMVSIFFDSMREAGEIVAEELSRQAPKGQAGGRGKDSLASSFGVWRSKGLSRKYRTQVFRVGLKTNYFYLTLAKGRKAHTRDGKPIRGNKASHPSWRLPGEDPEAAAQVVALTKSIFNRKVGTIDQIIGRGKRRR